MEGKKKHKGTKARVQAYKKRLQYIGTAITITILAAIIAVSSFLIYPHLNPSPNQPINPDQTNNQPSQPKAAIIDQLSLTAPNQTFIQKATNTLKQAGYTVDYYPGEEVTVELYRNLPTHEHSLIILRVHSALSADQPPSTLFTSELISKTKYVYEQLTDQLRAVRFLPYTPGDPWFFGIPPKFVSLSMNGRFRNATVIAMGCDGLRYTDMAEALIEKGAKAYISWNGPVSASHTDQATTHLLQHLLVENQTIRQAVTETMKEVGPDPVHNSILLYHPPEVGGQTAEDIISNLTTNR